jgi:hypothetical protein
MKATTKKITFTKLPALKDLGALWIVKLDGVEVGEIEATDVLCWDGRKRVQEYCATLDATNLEMPDDMDMTESFEVRGANGETDTLEGVTAAGQLAAAKAWVKAQLAKI